MPRVLIVDDAENDRLIAAKVLESLGDVTTAFAPDGRAGLHVVSRFQPDLVLTDLVMPEMTGLELVSAMRESYPLIPVILMTSKGSEKTAVEALEAGAASYVPKKALAADLPETVRKVLSVTGERVGQARLMKCFTEMNHAAIIENDYTLVTAIVIHVQETMRRLGLCDDGGWMHVGIAMEEALANALYHGNYEIGSDLRETDPAGYGALVAERSATRPYRDRRLHVSLRFLPSLAELTVMDEGPGFDVRSILPPTLPDVDRCSGRGLFLMHTFMDEVRFNDAGNAVTLIKRKSGTNGGA